MQRMLHAKNRPLSPKVWILSVTNTRSAVYLKGNTGRLSQCRVNLSQTQAEQETTNSLWENDHEPWFSRQQADAVLKLSQSVQITSVVRRALCPKWIQYNNSDSDGEAETLRRVERAMKQRCFPVAANIDLLIVLFLIVSDRCVQPVRCSGWMFPWSWRGNPDSGFGQGVGKLNSGGVPGPNLFCLENTGNVVQVTMLPSTAVLPTELHGE